MADIGMTRSIPSAVAILIAGFVAFLGSAMAVRAGDFLPLSCGEPADGPENICVENACVSIEPIHNPAFVHFHVDCGTGMDDYHWNFRYGTTQGDIGNRQSTYVPRGKNISIQQCFRNATLLGESHCFPWYSLKLSRLDECEAYAKKAVESARFAPACKLSGPRWDTDLSNHLDWCINIDDRSAPDREATEREMALGACRAALPPMVDAAQKLQRAQRWIVFATDGKGRYGYGIGPLDQARNVALKGCGGTGCKIAHQGQGKCFAYAESRKGGYWYGVSIAATSGEAVPAAVKGCQGGAPPASCKIVNAQCG